MRGPWPAGAAFVLLVAFSARAQTPEGPAPEGPAAADSAAPPAAEPPSQEGKLTQAKELFRKGNDLRSAGDYEAALDMYLASRRLVPSIPNTLNAALTLDHLGRYDEALEMYEQLFSNFSNLDEKDKTAVASAMRVLKSKVGAIDISSNVDGVLLIDGRQRGKLPLTSPVPVLPGRHVVRVLKDGYDTFETRIEVKVREKELVDARLKRLSHVGKLRVDDPKLAGADLFIDGAKVGTLPWEGTLAPGLHRYLVRKDDVGTAPRSAIVVEGQTVLVEVKAGPLSGDLRVVAEPPTAELYIDGIPVGPGQWQGRLPIGKYQLEARESGYHFERKSLYAVRDRGGSTTLKLRVDPESPRWGRPESGKPWVEAFAGWGFATSIGSDVEASCGDGACSSHRVVNGPLAGVRGGWQFPFGASVELGAGFLSLSTKVARSLGDNYDGGNGSVPIRYDFDDQLRFQGPFVLVGAGYPIALSGRLSIALRADIGVVFAGARDDIDAQATALGRTVPAEVESSGKTVRSAAVFANPEARLVWSFGRLHAGVGLGALLFPVTGPKLETGDTRVVGGDKCDPNPPPAGQSRPVECAKNSSVVAGERSYSPFVVWVPVVVAGYTF
jgi:PEGA domain